MTSNDLIIISGGQTGADRGGLDAAIALGIPYFGWCPQGRLAEDGRIPERYVLKESASRDYAERTRANVGLGHVTLVFVENAMGLASPGTRLTLSSCRRLSKPVLVTSLADDSTRVHDSVLARSWLLNNRPTDDVLAFRVNVAGTRESKAPGIQAKVRDFLIEVLREAS